MINIFPHRWDRQKQKQKTPNGGDTQLLMVETPNSSWWRHPTPSWWSHPHTTTSDEKPPPPPGLLLQVDDSTFPDLPVVEALEPSLLCLPCLQDGGDVSTVVVSAKTFWIGGLKEFFNVNRGPKILPAHGTYFVSVLLALERLAKTVRVEIMVAGRLKEFFLE